MARIGNFGSQIIFETSDKKILNFQDFEQTIAGRWVQHERIGAKPLQEFLGPDLRKIAFKIVLSASHGVKPRSTLEKIEKVVENGTAEKLVIGGKAIGANKWVIASMTETWDKVMNKGELLQASLSLDLEEYL